MHVQFRVYAECNAWKCIWRCWRCHAHHWSLNLPLLDIMSLVHSMQYTDPARMRVPVCSIFTPWSIFFLNLPIKITNLHFLSSHLDDH